MVRKLVQLEETLASPVDLMFQTSDTADVPNNEPSPRTKHFDEAISLTHGVMIGPVAAELSSAMLTALTPRGENVSAGDDNDFVLYGLLRPGAPAGESPRTPDVDRRLQRVAALLRVVRPHAMSLGTTVRIARDGDGRRVIYPNLASGPGSAAYVADPEHRWIRDQDVDAARELIAAVDAQETTLPDRVTRAIFVHEMIHWNRSADVRWALLAMALEGLIHTHDRNRKGFRGDRIQFVERWDRLQDRMGARVFENEAMHEIFGHRSHTMHGGGFRELWEIPTFSTRYREAEDLLRRAIRAAILRPDIAAILASDDSVRDKLGDGAA